MEPSEGQSLPNTKQLESLHSIFNLHSGELEYEDYRKLNTFLVDLIDFSRLLRVPIGT